MSAFGGKADVNHCVGECPLLAISGHTATRVRSPKLSRNGLYGPPPETGYSDLSPVRRPCDPALRARAGGGVRLRPVWIVRAAVAQVDVDGVGRGGHPGAERRRLGALASASASAVVEHRVRDGERGGAGIKGTG